jgi:hypothetical protein
LWNGRENPWRPHQELEMHAQISNHTAQRFLMIALGGMAVFCAFCVAALVS